MKRFYKSAAAVQTESGYMVNLDGRPVRTPARAPLVLPGLALGEAVAAEWNALIHGARYVPSGRRSVRGRPGMHTIVERAPLGSRESQA